MSEMSVSDIYDSPAHAYRGDRGGRCEVCGARKPHSRHKEGRRYIKLPMTEAISGLGWNHCPTPEDMLAAPPAVQAQPPVPKRNMVVIPQDLIERIDDYWHKERFWSRSAALRSLIEKGLSQ